MTSSAAVQSEAAAITACTICRDVQRFDLLIEDMEALLGESWGDLAFDDALAFLAQPEADRLDFVALVLDGDDEDRLPLITEIIGVADAKGVKVLLVAEDVSPGALHRLLRVGAADFLPYPLPEGALREALDRIRLQAAPAMAAPPGDPAHAPAAPSVAGAAGGHARGKVLAVHGLAGGVGASTFAVNLAWELALGAKARGRRARAPEAPPPRVCLLDLDFQTGSCATYLDLPRRDVVYEMLTDLAAIDAEGFADALQVHGERLHVLTAPADILPLDIVGPEEMGMLLGLAQARFDFVVVDMPTALVTWSEAVLQASEVYFALMELDMRSAQNALRFLRLLKAEDLPVEKLRFALNRAPGFADMQGKARARRLAESLDIRLDILLPDGARAVPEAGDHGQPLAETAPKNALRREIAVLAETLRDLTVGAVASSG